MKHMLTANLDENEEKLCELWGEEQIEIKPHSRLYNLEPIGIGSPFVESLTSYVNRLAEAHSVLPRKLVTVEIMPYLHHDGHPIKDYQTAFWKASATLNGVNETTSRFVHVLEQLTSRKDLSFLTMLPFREVISNRLLMRPTRAWCVICFEEWRKLNQPIYEPLLWALYCVGICPKHSKPFQLNCPNPDCKRTPFPLSPRGKPGYCAWCGQWLGSASPIESRVPERSQKEKWIQPQWAGDVIGELLAAVPSLPTALRLDKFAEYIDRMVKGNISGLSRQLQISRREIQFWRQGLNLPQLETLLQVCALSGVTPFKLLIQDGEIEDIVSHNEQHSSISFKKPRRQYRKFSKISVMKALEAASNEEPPPSMKEMSRRLKYTPAYLARYFPELCQTTSTRFLEYQTKKGLERFQRSCDQVRQAVYDLHAQGYYPSKRRVEAFLGKPGICREEIIYSAWEKALQELGL